GAQLGVDAGGQLDLDHGLPDDLAGIAHRLVALRALDRDVTAELALHREPRWRVIRHAQPHVAVDLVHHADVDLEVGDRQRRRARVDVPRLGGVGVAEATGGGAARRAR